MLVGTDAIIGLLPIYAVCYTVWWSLMGFAGKGGISTTTLEKTNFTSDTIPVMPHNPSLLHAALVGYEHKLAELRRL